MPVIDDTFEDIDPRLLSADPDNPRQAQDPEVIKSLAASIRQLGLAQPITIDENNVVRLGELRWRATLEIKRNTIKARRVTGLTPEEWLLWQTAENFQRTDLSERDITNLLYRLREARRQGRIPAPEGFGIEVPKPRGGRPYEPGNTRELAALVHKSHHWVQRFLSDASVDPDDVPPALRTALSEDRLTRDAVAMIRRRCPPTHQQPLIDKLAEETTRGFVPTQAVRAVVAGLCAEQNDQDKAERLIDLIQGGEKGSFTEAQVKVLAPDAVIDSPQKSKSPAVPPRRRGPEEAVIRHGLDFVRAVEHVGEAADSRNLVQALRSVHGAAGQLLDRLGYAPKERATPPESRPLSPPPPPDPRLDGLKTRQFTLFRILQDADEPLNKDQLLERLGYGDDYHPDRLEVDMTELERHGLVVGEGVGVWRAMKPEKPSY